MTDIEQILKAKIEAVTALQAYVDAYVTAHSVSSAEGVMRVIATWVDAMREMAPQEKTPDANAVWCAGDPDPGSEVQVVRDSDGDLQYRKTDGQWSTHANPGLGFDAWTWSRMLDRWGPVTKVK